MKDVCVLTTSRAEYGLLYPLLRKFEQSVEFRLHLVVSGTHLESNFGRTKDEIYADGFQNIIEMDILEETGDSAKDSSIIIANATRKMAKYLEEQHLDIAFILGDRYEMIGFAIALVNERVPIAHINGGETTGGALDEIYRHCLTKMSTIHFPNCELHKKRIIQMGEDRNKVFNVGDLCVDNIKNTKLLNREDLEKELGISFKNPVVVVTFHPVTMESDSEEQLMNLLEVLDANGKYTYVFTMPNNDRGGRSLTSIIENYVGQRDNCILVPSMGRVRYLSLLSQSFCVIGNSSSGLYEVPYFHIPTINIGNRQKNRYHGATVIDCGSRKQSIQESFEKAAGAEFRRKCFDEKMLWGDGNAANKIFAITKELLNEKINITKTFYDL